MRRPNRRKRPNRPHISSDIQFSKSADTKQTSRQYNQRNPRLASRLFRIVACRVHPHRRSLVRFGEAVFRQRRKKPQEEKDRMMTLFSKKRKFHNILGLVASAALFGRLGSGCIPLCPAPTAPGTPHQQPDHRPQIQHRLQRPSFHQHHIVDSPRQCRYIRQLM